MEANRRTSGEEHTKTLNYIKDLDRLKTKASQNTKGNRSSAISEVDVGPIKTYGRRGAKRLATTTLSFPGGTADEERGHRTMKLSSGSY